VENIMPSINNDDEFRQALLDLDPVQQRLAAARFVEHLLPLATDERVARVLRVAADPQASADALAGALKTARSAALDTHTRCGSEGDWREQAGYLVCRAATAALTPAEQARGGSPAWQAALGCRMARTSMTISDESASETSESEREWQYRALEKPANA
jgi:hypothetical protein